MILDYAFIFFLILIFYVYYGYGLLLKLFSGFVHIYHQSDVDSKAEVLPSITVLITVYNEKAVIGDRIENILLCNYPYDKLEVLIASDGSDDGTDGIVSSIDDDRVVLFRTHGRLGKTETQNHALEYANGEIVLFTDAGTRFDSDFVLNIASAFEDDAVGAVDGHLLFGSSDEGGLAESQGYYWNYELHIRQCESKLGMLAVSSGACLAVRKKLFHQMDPSVGEDCIVPLDVLVQGGTVLHQSSAMAYDYMDKSGSDEFRARVRMTLRNWQGTWSRPVLLNPLKYPRIAFSLWSHKLLRWLSPFFLVGASLISVYKAASGSSFYQFFLFIMVVFMFFSLHGWYCEKRRYRCRVSSIAYSFVVANAGFFIGVMKAAFGHRVTSYR